MSNTLIFALQHWDSAINAEENFFRLEHRNCENDIGPRKGKKNYFSIPDYM